MSKRVCVCEMNFVREREKERKRNSPRIITNQTIVFTRINFNLQLNSSPQLKIKKKRNKREWYCTKQRCKKFMRDDRFRRALLNERPVIDWFCFFPVFPNPWFFFKFFMNRHNEVNRTGLSNVHIAILVWLHLVI